MRVAIVGASGKMGRALVRLAPEYGLQVAAAISLAEVGKDAGELAGVGALGVRVEKDLDAAVKAGAAVAIDFAGPDATRALCELAAKSEIAVVSGTTGLDDAAKRALDDAARSTAVLWEPNMSVGIYVLGQLVERAVRMLGPDYDIEIIEAHHNQKADAPSGTAMRLAEMAQRGREGTRLVHGREGRPGARDKREIGMHAVRGGDVIGDHTVTLFGQGERIELSHRASNRDLFARGALRCAAWLAGKPAGRYGLADVLGG